MRFAAVKTTPGSTRPACAKISPKKSDKFSHAAFRIRWNRNFIEYDLKSQHFIRDLVNSRTAVESSELSALVQIISVQFILGCEFDYLDHDTK